MLSVHQDLKSIIQRTGKFLDHPLSTPDILQLEDHLSFESMKENRATNYELVIEINKENNLIDKEKCERGAFMRSGKIGGLPVYVRDSVGHISNLPGRRFIKAHLPLRLLPKKLQDGSTKAKEQEKTVGLGDVFSQKQIGGKSKNVVMLLYTEIMMQ
ncbi:uncharacterized protein LOC113470897 [Diaphorina citri]|uniref:Uncharacterized protein LOC113470897 n=1 Tax=Diaphorina citri TaxID=121845 RepID=A0A3Q0JAC4_DIACI|nr:uncharacterized protein LOC113470897 [Diaphorina citri]